MKQGDLVEVSDDTKLWCERVFVVFNKGSYICESIGNANYTEWIYARNIDKHKEIKQAYEEGAIIESYSEGIWKRIKTAPKWLSGYKYRIKGGISINTWNVHKEAIKAYWGGEGIEWLSITGEYIDIEEPLWLVDGIYRVKEEPLFFYRWKKLKNHYIEVTELTSDDLRSNGYERIESSKTTFEGLV